MSEGPSGAAFFLATLNYPAVATGQLSCPCRIVNNTLPHYPFPVKIHLLQETLGDCIQNRALVPQKTKCLFLHLNMSCWPLLGSILRTPGLSGGRWAPKVQEEAQRGDRRRFCFGCEGLQDSQGKLIYVYVDLGC